MGLICNSCVTQRAVICEEDIFMKGQLLKSMYFLKRGGLRYIRGRNRSTIFATWLIHEQFSVMGMTRIAGTSPGDMVKKGQWAGEPALWLEWMAGGCLQASCTSDLVEIDVAKF